MTDDSIDEIFQRKHEEHDGLAAVDEALDNVHAALAEEPNYDQTHSKDQLEDAKESLEIARALLQSEVLDQTLTEASQSKED